MSEIGKVYGRWTVIGEPFKKGLQVKCMCRCSCQEHTEKLVDLHTLKTGSSKSCGCIRKEMLSDRSSTHKESKTRLYKVWCGMKNRCFNKNNSEYHNYGGRGIKVCKEWENSFSAFRKWAYENGYDANAEYGKCTLDRIDVNGNYEPSNCRWVSAEIQTRNTRSNVFITYKGVTKRLMDWSDELGIEASILRDRCRLGYDINRIFEPKRKKHYLTFKGETHTLAEWSEITGIKYSTISGRARKGLKPEEILSKEKLKRKAV